MTTHIDSTELYSLTLRLTDQPGINETPGALLLGLLEDIAQDETDSGDPMEACEVLAARGTGWQGRPAIGVRVREDSDGEQRVGYTWCTLGDLLECVHFPYDAPDWWDRDWTEVQDDDGKWVQRDVLRARGYRAAFINDTVLTGPEHAHVPEDELRAEALAEAKRANVMGGAPAFTLAEFEDQLEVGLWRD